MDKSPIPYSTGTWTPVLTAQTAGNLSVTYTKQVGHYTRVGNLVFLNWNIITSAFTHTNASGIAEITGIPFNVANNADQHHWGALEWSGITKANNTDVVSRLLAGATFLDFVITGSAQAGAQLAITDLPTGGSVVMRGSIAYNAA